MSAPRPNRRTSVRLLRRTLVAMDGHYARGATPTVRHLLDPLGSEAAALGAALIALPFLSPVSLGPITTAASTLLLLFGWQILRRREGMPLPARLLDLAVPRPMHGTMATVLRRVSRWMARLSRPRHARLVEGRRGRLICGTGIVLGALLLAVPIPLLPLTNTFPALGVLLFALGWSERDGLLTLLGSAALLLSAAVFAALGLLAGLVGIEVIRAALPFAAGT